MAHLERPGGVGSRDEHVPDRSLLTVQHQGVGSIWHQLEDDLRLRPTASYPLEMEDENTLVGNRLSPSKRAGEGVIALWRFKWSEKRNAHCGPLKADQERAVAQVQVERVAPSVEEDGPHAGAAELSRQLRSEAGGKSRVKTDRHVGKVAWCRIAVEGGSDGIPPCLASMGVRIDTVLSVENGLHLPCVERLNPNP